MTALRQRLIEVMQVRNYSPRTVEAYAAAVAKLHGHNLQAQECICALSEHVGAWLTRD